MKLLENIKEDRIHSRNIDVTTYELDDKTILVYGELIDRRLVDTYGVEEELRNAGIVHHMRICLKVNLSSLTIEDIEKAIAQGSQKASRKCPTFWGMLQEAGE